MGCTTMTKKKNLPWQSNGGGRGPHFGKIIVVMPDTCRCVSMQVKTLAAMLACKKSVYSPEVDTLPSLPYFTVSPLLFLALDPVMEKPFENLVGFFVPEN